MLAEVMLDYCSGRQPGRQECKDRAARQEPPSSLLWRPRHRVARPRQDGETLTAAWA